MPEIVSVSDVLEILKSEGCDFESIKDLISKKSFVPQEIEGTVLAVVVKDGSCVGASFKKKKSPGVEMIVIDHDTRLYNEGEVRSLTLGGEKIPVVLDRMLPSEEEDFIDSILAEMP